MYIFNYNELNKVEKEKINKCHAFLDILDKHNDFIYPLLGIKFRIVGQDIKCEFCFISTKYCLDDIIEHLKNISEFSQVLSNSVVDENKNILYSIYSLKFNGEVFRMSVFDQYHIEYFYNSINSIYSTFGKVEKSPFNRDIILIYV